MLQLLVHSVSSCLWHVQLVEVINEDYNDFVSLSTKLVNVDGAVLRMQKPLLELRVGAVLQVATR